MLDLQRFEFFPFGIEHGTDIFQGTVSKLEIPVL